MSRSLTFNVDSTNLGIGFAGLAFPLWLSGVTLEHRAAVKNATLLGALVAGGHALMTGSARSTAAGVGLFASFALQK